MSESLPAPIALPFGWRRRAAPISLFRGPLELRAAERSLALCEGEILFRWLPSPGVAFAIPDQRLEGAGEDTTLLIADLDLKASVMLTSWNLGGGEVRGLINRAPFPPTASIRHLRFLIPNYLLMKGGDALEERRAGKRHVYSGRLRLVGRDWDLIVDERPDAEAVKQRLRARSGHEVTHTAALRRRDGSTFSDGDARDMLTALATFFGLTRGAWAPPLLALGYDGRGRVIWRDWQPATTSAWRAAMNVIDVYHPHALAEAFDGFLRAWQDDLWREPLLYATQMYVQANGPVFAETSLVLTQAALELLAWVRIVEDERSMSADEFDKLRYGAAARIRKLLEWLDVDPAVPSSLSALASEANRLRWTDGPHAIDALRNALIHPDKRQRIEDTSLAARIDLHELALWYVEVALLRVIGFAGNYSSRLGNRTAGSVISVPWS